MIPTKGKWIAMTVAAALTMIPLAACNDKDANSGEAGSGANANEPVKLRMLGPSGSNKYIRFEDREKYPVWKEVQKMLDEANLQPEYELVPNEQYNVVIKTRMASGSKLPDIVNVSALDNTTLLNLAKQGIIVDLNELIDKYSTGNIKNMYTKLFPFAKKTTTSPDGKMYWFSNLHIKTYKEKELAPVALTMTVRKDWLDKLNLKAPTTAKEYMDTLKAFRDRDANGNGQADEVLVYDPSTFSGAIAQWFGLGTDITAVDVENKKVVSPWYQPGIKEYFAYIQQLVKAGILDTSLIGAKGEQILQKVTENKVASSHEYGMIMSREQQAKGSEYLPLMPLKAMDGITPAAVLEPPHLVWQKYAITKDAKNPEAAIKFFDMIYSEKYADLLYWGIEGETYKKDTDGSKMYINTGSDEEKAKALKVNGSPLFGDTVFPRVQFANLEFELKQIPSYKADYQLKMLKYKPYFVNMNQNYLAIPDDKQLEEKTKILTNLTTYSSELATKLALGQKSLDQWDTYMAELKKLGLDRLIEIDQQLHNRYNSFN
ncbi:MAG: transporter substrate-binding protein [Paenibacillus sp.]|uniref:extracellular solute-binding protein n=1 Tax=Paenibacillus sp. GCM10012303 TaxID=3317340 RepID=UPI0029EAAAD6|nr:transporter substrate-binding protein [Paenibacillus sp.]